MTLVSKIKLARPALVLIYAWLVPGCGSEDKAPEMSASPSTSADNDQDAGLWNPDPGDNGNNGNSGGGPIDTNAGENSGGTPSEDAGAAPTDELDGGAEPDAGGGGSGGPGLCEGDTPHGCYTLAGENPEGCPAQIPEIPTIYPFKIKEWDGCSNKAVKAFEICKYEGPNRATGTCICDTGLHWICIYPQAKPPKVNPLEP